MKKLGLIIFLIFTTYINLFSQEFKENFLGESFYLYRNTLFKIDENSTSGFLHSFYDDIKKLEKTYNENVIYPDNTYSFKTNKDSLINRIFQVEDILGKNGDSFNQNLSSGNPVFKLVDISNGKIIFYKYEPEFSSSFPFLVSGVKIDKDVLCKDLEKNVDDFTNEIKINSPIILNSEISPIIFHKFQKGSNIRYILDLNTSGLTVNVGKFGAIILFEDGTKLTKNVEIDVDADEDGFDYSAWISLSSNDVKILSEKSIDKFRLYIYDEDIDSGQAEIYKSYLNCLIQSK